MWRRNRWIFLGGVVAFAVLFLILRKAPVATDPTPPPAPTTTAPAAATMTGTAAPARAPSEDVLLWRTKEGYVGATSRAKLDQATALMASGDQAAFAALLAAEPANVFLLAKGTEVYVSDADGVLGSVVKIRKKGTTAEIWTVREAIEK